MRSRPDVRVYLSPPELEPGTRVVARVVLHSKTTTPCDGVDVTLVGRESRYHRTVSTGKSSRRKYHRREIVRLAHRADVASLVPGERELAVAFDLPADAPPTYESTYGSIAYELSVRVRIPWWPDRHVTYALPVSAVRRAVQAGPLTVTTARGDEADGDVTLELSVGERVVAPGGTLAGAAAVLGLAPSKRKRLELAVVAVETALVPSSAGPTDTYRHVWTLDVANVGDGEPAAFTLALPSDLPTSFSSPFRSVTHALEAKVGLGWGRARTVRLPLVVARGASPVAHEAAPAVGRRRREAIWSGAEAVAARFGAGARQSEEALVLEWPNVRAELREEERDGKPCVAVEFELAPLGIDLRVTERSWSDFGGRVAEVDAGFQKRFLVACREGPQAAAALSREVRDALSWFHEAALSDEGAVVLRRGGVAQPAALERLLAHVVTLGMALAATRAEVPPPAALASRLPAFERFAERVGARVRRGDVSVHGWEVRGTLVRVAHRPGEGGAWRVAVEVDRPEDVTEERWRAALAASGAQLEGDCARTWPEGGDAPNGLEPAAGLLAEAARAARGGGYR